jgi:hypothetical protein
VNPRTITVDKNPAYPKATAEMKKDGELWRRSRLRQVKYLNNIVEQDHRRVERLTRPGLGFGGFWTARRTLAGYEAMAMARKGQVRNISGNDIRAQATFIAGLFQVAACGGSVPSGASIVVWPARTDKETRYALAVGAHACTGTACASENFDLPRINNQ